ncbi:Aste57867_1492 [Aphanomyces stellatus]|uniref:Aste57867_1492 protein n=1 Tax=Aphanomyces stellatus TaxID=120398 RepID=A0A485K6K8_9STRA|nr:hypothetical protein As57867_001491 [Aphanomyces stellatus]VFT78708.1 Aste57867_1492 [Aphanomyces stellatus]
MSNSIKALTTHDVLRIICRFQTGVPEDLVPIAKIPVVLMHSYAPPPWFAWANDGTMDAKYPTSLFDDDVFPWLLLHGLDRLQLLLSYLPRVAPMLVQFAAYHGRLDLLVAVRTILPEILAQSWHLLSLAALQGHIEVYKYLVHVGYQSDLLPAGRAAAWAGHVNLLDTMVALHSRAWIQSATFTCAARAGQTAAFQWLWTQWTVTDRYAFHRTIAMRKGLEEAIHNGHDRLAQWIAGIDEPAIRRILFVVFMEEESDAADFIVIEHMGHGADVDWALEALSTGRPKNVLRKVQLVFTVLDKRPSQCRRDAERVCLLHAAKQSHNDVMHWLLDDRHMHPTDVQHVFEATRHGRAAVQRAIRKQRTDLLLALQSRGVDVTEVMRMELYTAVGILPLAQWLGDDTTPMRTFFESSTWLGWIIERLGGHVAVMGQVLGHISRTNHGLDCFPSLFEAWYARVTDVAEKDRVLSACLARDCSPMVVTTLMPTFPTAAAFLIQQTQSSSIRHLRRALDELLAQESTTMDTRHIERDMLCQAIKARRYNVTAWLGHRLSVTNAAAVEYAMEWAIKGEWTKGREILGQCLERARVHREDGLRMPI